MTALDSETVERTRAFDKAEKMGQAIRAFANDLPGRGGPGYLLLGVEDNGEISHRRITDEQMTALGGLKTEGNLLPQPSLCIEKFSFDDGDVELDAFVKVGFAQPHPVKVSALREETFYHYPNWTVRELLLNAVIHRDYQLGKAPIKFYDYNGTRLEISNPGGLYGLAKPDNFPLVNDYRNPLLA